jgi:hypothetical protein
MSGVTTLVGGANLADRLAPPPSSIPAGFDAVLQFDPILLQHQLARNLSNAGLSALSARVPYRPASTPPALRAAIEAQLPRFSMFFGQVQVEVRLARPQLRTLRSSIPLPPTLEEPLENAGVSDPIGISSSGPSLAQVTKQLTRPIEIDWTLEINLIELTPKLVLSGETHLASSGKDFFVEKRTLLAKGKAITPARAELVIRSTLLQLWLELEFIASRFRYQSEMDLFSEFLDDQLARDMLSQAVEPLVSATNVRLTPHLALAGQMSANQIAQMQLSAPRLHVLVLLHPDGREILSICLNFGEDSEGAERLIRPFVSGRNFAYFVSERLFKPILRERWRANPALRWFEGEVPVEMRLSENSEETGEGRARVRVQIAADVTEVQVQASENELGDAVRLESEQTIQLLRLWDPQNDEVTDLGDLGEPNTEPFIMHALLFDDPPPELAGDINPAFLKFVTKLFMPIARPFLENVAIEQVGGFASSALKAILVRWDVKLPDVGIAESVSSDSTVGVQ